MHNISIEFIIKVKDFMCMHEIYYSDYNCHYVKMLLAVPQGPEPTDTDSNYQL